MSDLRLTWSPDALACDLSIVANDLETDEGLETALVRSLFEHRRAELGDELPVGEVDRRGWWADAVPVVEGDKIGSRLWLLDRETNRPDVLARAEQYAREALQWLLDDSVAAAVDVVAEFLADPAGLAISVTVHRPTRDPARYRFGRAWLAQEARI